MKACADRHSQEELELVRRVQQGLITDDLHDPYPETVEYFTSIEEKMRMYPKTSWRAH